MISKDIIEKTKDLTWLDSKSNKVILIGEFLGIEEEGFYNGKSHFLVLFKTNRAKNKPLFVWLAFENNIDNKNYLLENLNKKIYIEGSLIVINGFNNKAVSHTFINPEIMTVLTEEELLELDNLKIPDFVSSYTTNNRIVIEGVIVGEIWKEYIEPANKYVTRFQVEILVNGKPRKVYCTVWDTIYNSDSDSLRVGLDVRIIGSYTMLKKERGLIYKDGYILESRKNKLDSYVVIVQKITF